MKKFKLLLIGLLALTALGLLVNFSQSAFAVGPDFSDITVDLTPVYALAAIIGAALVGMIAVRKGIKLFNRS